MNCTNCGRAHGATARFCGGCGKPVVPRCPQCSAETPPDAQFCEACGASLAPRPADDATARKVVTIVFADLVGSTALHERLDAESVRHLMDRYYQALHAAVDAHGGTVVKLLGDGVMAAFGVPRVAEDDAIRAVRAAVDMQRTFRALAQDQSGVGGALGLRVAVNTGEVVVSADHADVVGDPVNVAARLQQEARDGDVLVGESTQRLVRELVTLEPCGIFALKGRSETVAAYRVVSLERPAGVPATPFVGRDAELRRVMAVHATAVAERRARLVVVLGSPGLGKSRLLAEVAHRLGDGATVLTAQCDAAGGATFAPIAGALRTLLRIDDVGDGVRAAIEAVLPGDEPERARIADGVAALLAGTPASPEETFFVVRRFLAALATEQPVVLAIDDLQWAEPLLLDLIEHLAQWSTGVPLLLLAAARPELRDARSSLAAPGGLVTDVVTLRGLDAGAATRLAANVVGAEELPAAIAGRVLATSEGNPLFVGELVRMLVQDGALTREGDRWTAGGEVAALEMPPTIQALLAARIERLRPEERTVLERAAVVGRQFSRAAVTHLLPREMRTDLDARLESLRRSELIEPDTGWFLGEPVLRFHHVLIRDAAYRRLLKETRAELHGRFANWLETRVGQAVEHDETLGWHLEQAHQHLRELGPIDETGRAFGDRAARYLAAAGRRALARDDLPLATSLLGRALDRLDGADPGRADLALDWCEALLAAGDVAPAARAIDELGRLTGDSDRLRAWHTCFAGQLAVLTDPQALRATADAVEVAAQGLASSGDAAGEAKAHQVHATALARLGRVGACEAALDRALAAARRARDRRRANVGLAGAPVAALWGPSPVTRASGRCLDVVRVLRITQGAPAVEAVALRCQAVLEALRGRTEAARRMITTSRRMVEELGITHRLLEAEVFAGLIDLLEGDATAAERCLRGAYDGLREHGLRIDAAQAAALLGRALLAQGRAAEAEALSVESEALAGDDLQAAIAWRGVRAEALARRGEHAAAVDFARAAVDIAAATDALLHHADARLALAAVLRAAGRSDEAGVEEARAIELWEAKGATLLAERARRDAGRFTQTDRPPDDRARPSHPARRRVRPNAATTNAARFDAAVAARDVDAFDTIYADGVETVHNPTGKKWDRAGSLRTWQGGLGSGELEYAHEPLATLGDALALCRLSASFTGLGESELASIGIVEKEDILLIEVDGHGRRTRVEVFAADHLGDAVARLYERYADLLPDGPARDRAAATARSLATIFGPFDLDRVGTAVAPAAELIDRRSAGFGSVDGAEQLIRTLATVFEVAGDVMERCEDVIAVQPNALLVSLTWSGKERVGGGEFELPHLQLYILGADGLLTHVETFAADQRREALARYDELTIAPTAPRIENAATRALERGLEAWEARDWERFAALFAAGFRGVDRRTMVQLELDRDQWLDSYRSIVEMTSSRPTKEVLATRGERLVLVRVRWEGTDGSIGPSEIEWLLLIEVDDRGDHLAVVTFDPGDLDGAYAELNDRYAAGEAAAYGHAAMTRTFLRAFATRDWSTLATLLTPDLVVNDHRILGWETLRGSEAYVQALRSLVDLAPDARLRLDHVVEMSHHAVLYAPTWIGTHEGGAFEGPSVIVAELDGRRRIRRFDQYDLDQLDDARARFDAVGANTSRDPLEGGDATLTRFTEPGSDPLRIPPNAATRASDRWFECIGTRDWDALRALCAPIVWEDRRRLIRTTGDCDMAVANSRLVAHAGTRASRTLLATAGNRLALQRIRWKAGEEGADSEIETLELVEVDPDGRVLAGVVFDPDDRRAAMAELTARYFRSDAARWAPAWVPEMGRAIRDRDLDRVRAALPEHFVFHDHRRTGLGRVERVDDYIASCTAMLELSPDVDTENLYQIATEQHGTLSVGRTFGTLADGGEFEFVFVRLQYDAGAELFELEDLDVARARFEELRPRR